MEVQRIKIRDTLPNIEGRPVDKKTVKRLSESMDRVGMINPITVYKTVYAANGKPNNPGFGIIAGGHRYAAAKVLGWEELDAFVIDSDSATHHRLIEITENLHRAELTVQARAKLTKEWVDSVKTVSAQLGPKLKVGRPDSGLNDAARQLGLERKEVQRAVKIATISPEADEVAIALGLDDNQSALLEAAKQSEPEEQVKVLKSRAAKKAEKKTAADLATAEKIVSLLESIRDNKEALDIVFTALMSMTKE